MSSRWWLRHGKGYIGWRVAADISDPENATKFEEKDGLVMQVTTKLAQVDTNALRVASREVAMEGRSMNGARAIIAQWLTHHLFQ